MSEWDDDLFPDQKKKEQEARKAISGPWDVLLTVFTLIVTAGAAFLMAFLTKDIPSRPFWLLALNFAVPVAALMLSAWLKEKAVPSMTPNTSRNAQLILALCSILAAAVVGCFSQVSNQEASKAIERDGWSNILIILDKSGSMTMSAKNGQIKNDNATNAVIQLLGEMHEENTRVGLLIDNHWEENSLDARLIRVAPLTDAHRLVLIAMAKRPATGRAEFAMSLDTAYDMLSHEADPGSFTLLYISDGKDEARQKSLIAEDYSEKYNQLGVKINYIYVDDEYSNELKRLAELTQGSSMYAVASDEIAARLQQMATVPVYVYKDALRNIDESPSAKIVTAVLLLLLGVLIGFSLTIMFSLQGQKRAQLFLSPAMALLAFLLLAFGKSLAPGNPDWNWLREGIAFTLLGVVVMRSNRLQPKRKAPAPAAAGTASSSSSFDFNDIAPPARKPASAKKAPPSKTPPSDPGSLDDLW